MTRSLSTLSLTNQLIIFSRLKLKERKYTFLEIQEEYIKDEVKNLKRELLRAQGEVLMSPSHSNPFR
jgi:26S proteasome regulatory subunit T3